MGGNFWGPLRWALAQPTQPAPNEALAEGRTIGAMAMARLATRARRALAISVKGGGWENDTNTTNVEPTKTPHHRSRTKFGNVAAPKIVC